MYDYEDALLYTYMPFEDDLSKQSDLFTVCAAIQ